MSNMKDNKPYVSVIIPFYNEEDFLDETIQSVLNQTYQNWELLLVDDGSTNKSRDIAMNYASEYEDRVRHLKHPGNVNKGSSATRNLGIENSRGDLIAFLDADDFLEPDYLKYQTTLFRTTKAVMVCEATKYWYSWNDQQKKDEIIPIGAPPDQLYQPRQLNRLLYPLKKGAAAPCMCGIVISREVLLKHGGFNEAFTGMYDDQVFLTKIYYNEKVYISSSCNNRYRQRNNSLMSTAKEREDYIHYRTRYLEWLKAYLNNSNNKDKEIYSTVKKILLPYKYPLYHNLFHQLPRKIFNRLRKNYL